MTVAQDEEMNDAVFTAQACKALLAYPSKRSTLLPSLTVAESDLGFMARIFREQEILCEMSGWRFLDYGG